MSLRTSSSPLNLQLHSVVDKHFVFNFSPPQSSSRSPSEHLRLQRRLQLLQPPLLQTPPKRNNFN
eukprot:4045556-Amphidinium_carterae.1